MIKILIPIEAANYKFIAWYFRIAPENNILTLPIQEKTIFSQMVGPLLKGKSITAARENLHKEYKIDETGRWLAIQLSKQYLERGRIIMTKESIYQFNRLVKDLMVFYLHCQVRLIVGEKKKAVIEFLEKVGITDEEINVLSLLKSIDRAEQRVIKIAA